jgi:hypothetical protein
MRAMVWSHRRHYHVQRAALPFLFLAPLPVLGLMVAGVVGISLAFAVVVTVLAMLLSAAVAVATLGALGYGVWKLVQYTTPLLTGTGADAPARRLHPGGIPAGRQRFTVETPVDALRRRYAAGEIGQSEFKRGLVELVKERYVRGDLTLDEYEARVRHIYQDPALRSPGRLLD